jgi:glyoxylase-like metal-dependent hydrolase (beta-lactamase superfamily II)
MTANDPRPIDLHHAGRAHVICAWQVGDIIVDPGPASCIPALLAGLGEVEPRVVALTHIHLDHAGATGSLVKRFPNLEVWVHERGARHLIDPSRLLASAGRLYGEDMERLWGEVLAVPAENVRSLGGGETVGPFRVAYTPGHASHHVSYLDESSGNAFTGDVTGVRIDDGPVLAPTPPPDIDLDLWRASLDTIEAWAPERLFFTHFGTRSDVPAHLALIREALERQARWARTLDERGFTERMLAPLTSRGDAVTAAAYQQGLPPGQSYQGLRRFLERTPQDR